MVKVTFKADSAAIKSKNGLEAQFFTCTIEQVIHLLGIEEAKKGEKGYPVNGPDGLKKYEMRKNKANRPFKFPLAKRYKDDFLNGMWAGSWNSPSETGNGETFVIDRNENVVSMAHRGFGFFMAEMERQRLEKIGAHELLEELGCIRPLTIPDCLVVTKVDPHAADTSDTGQGRSLGDVVFRGEIFTDKDFGKKETPTESDFKALSTILSVAIRLVWLRVNGGTVRGGKKLSHPVAMEFLKHHPLLKEACLFIYNENKTDDSANKAPIAGKDGCGLSLGYAAGHMYLAAFRSIDPRSYHDGSRQMGRKPSAKDWDAAGEFWQEFVNLKPMGTKNAKPVTLAMKKIFGEHIDGTKALDRDQLCTVITRGMLAYLEDPTQKITTNKLRAGLYNERSVDDFTAEFERFGGLDVDKTVLDELGFIPKDEALKEVQRTSVDNGKWKIEDTVWVYFPETEDTAALKWFGSIRELSDDRETATVYCADDDYDYEVAVANLCTDEPEIEEVEEEEVEELEPAE